MITAGIDVGLENIKAVIMCDGRILGKANDLSGGTVRPTAAQTVYNKALQAAGVKAAEVDRVASTGKGKFDVPFSDDTVPETMAAAKAAKLFEPYATMVADIGADEIVAATLENENVSEFVLNQKCAAGLGLLLEGMAERFEMSLEELGALEGTSTVTVDEGCAVFAELDALGLVNRGTDVAEVMKALIQACAWRANSTLNDIYRPNATCAVLIGGMAKNGAFVKALEGISGIKFLIPEESVYGGAIGAAALAAESNKEDSNIALSGTV